MKTILAIE